MKLFRLVAVLVTLTLLIGVLPLVSASSPDGLGNPTLRARATGNPNVTEIIAQNRRDRKSVV